MQVWLGAVEREGESPSRTCCSGEQGGMVERTPALKPVGLNRPSIADSYGVALDKFLNCSVPASRSFFVK